MMIQLRNPGQATRTDKIYLTPLTDVTSEIVAALVPALEQHFGLPVSLSDRITELTGIYDPQRKQFYSSRILTLLRQNLPTDAIKLLGITEKDIYAPGLNFVFGEAELRGKVAVISIARLKGWFSSKPLYKKTILKEAVHELGHTFGLTHCPNIKCVMHFSNMLRDTYAKKTSFCSSCQEELARLTATYKVVRGFSPALVAPASCRQSMPAES